MDAQSPTGNKRNCEKKGGNKEVIILQVQVQVSLLKQWPAFLVLGGFTNIWFEPEG